MGPHNNFGHIVYSKNTEYCKSIRTICIKLSILAGFFLAIKFQNWPTPFRLILDLRGGKGEKILFKPCKGSCCLSVHMAWVRGGLEVEGNAGRWYMSELLGNRCLLSRCLSRLRHLRSFPISWFEVKAFSF